MLERVPPASGGGWRDPCGGIQRSIWIRQALGAMLLDFEVCERAGVNRLTHPPRSGDLPGCPVES